MRIRFWIYVLFFLKVVCFAQAPENLAIQKKKLDSLVTLLNRIPENASKQNDTTRLKVVMALINKTEGDTQRYYVNDAVKKCNSYSKLVEFVETNPKTKIEEELKKDCYLFFYLKVKAELLIIIGDAEKNGDDKLHYYLQSLEICEKTGNKVGQARAHLYICDVYYEQSVFNKAVENLLVAQHLYSQLDNKKLLATSYRILGDIYQKQKLLDKSLQNYMVGLDIAKKTSDIFLLAVIYEHIGNCYIDMDNYPKAIENHFASLKASEQLKDIKGVGDSYGDIASIYYRMKDYKKCRINWLAALSKYKEFGKPYLIANGYRDVAEADYRLRDFNVGLLNLDSALMIYKNEKEYRDEILIYSLISDIYIEKHDLLNTVKYLNKAVEFSKKHHFMEELKKTYKALSDIYLKENDYKNAYKFHVLYADAKDSLLNNSDETMENINAMQSMFDKQKKEQEKLLHEAVVAQKEAKLEQEKTQRYALYGGLVLVLAFSIFVFNRFRVTQKQKVIIEQQKQMVDDAFKNLAEKNKEVMDSITYARRIQRALVTSELYIEKQLNRLIKGDN